MNDFCNRKSVTCLEVGKGLWLPIVTIAKLIQLEHQRCEIITRAPVYSRDVTDSESASESGTFLKSEIRRILKVRSQRIYGFRNCCFSPIYLLFIELFS